MLGMKPELSEAVGGDHVTCVDLLPLSAVVIMCDEQFENTGGDTSKKSKTTKTTTTSVTQTFADLQTKLQ